MRRRMDRRIERAWVALVCGGVLAGAWLTACQDGTAPSYVDDIRLLPDSAHVPVGESFDFRIAVFDQRDDSLPDRVSRVQLVNLNPEVVDAEVDGSLLHVTTLQAGKAVIDMRLGFGQGRAQVFVPPVRVARIEIDPSPIVLGPQERLEIHALLFDVDGEELSPTGHRVSWKVDVDPFTPAPIVSPTGATAFLNAGLRGTTVTLKLIVDNLVTSTQVTTTQ